MQVVATYTPKFNVTVGKDGFALLDEILALPHIKKTAPNCDISLQLIQDIVASSDKKRFTLKKDDEECYSIRANQGHSIKGVELDLISSQELTEMDPKLVCVHGIFSKHVSDILERDC